MRPSLGVASGACTPVDPGDGDVGDAGAVAGAADHDRQDLTRAGRPGARDRLALVALTPLDFDGNVLTGGLVTAGRPSGSRHPCGTAIGLDAIRNPR